MGPRHPARPITSRARKQTAARETRDMRERRDPKFEVRGSKFRKPRTFDRLARLTNPVRLSCGVVPIVPDVQAIEVLLCRNGFSAACLVKT